MYEKICCIYDVDENYAMRLSEALNNNESFPLRSMAFTSKDALLECMSEYDIELLMVDERLDMTVREEFSSIKYIVISEGENDLERDVISRYQSTESIVKHILYKIGREAVHTTCKTGVTAFYSPFGNTKKSLLAVSYSHSKGEGRRILYVNLEEFSGIRELFQDMGKSLSDAIYYCCVKNEEPLTGIINCIGHEYDFDYLSPVTCPDDLIEFSDEDLCKMIQLIKYSGIYDEIVLDV